MQNQATTDPSFACGSRVRWSLTLGVITTIGRFHMDSAELDNLISALEDELGSIEPMQAKWTPIWELVKRIGGSFKGVRYPTKAEKDIAWNRFQGLVDQVKIRQQAADAQWQTRVARSERLKAQLLALASRATPPSQLGEAIYAATFGILDFAIRSAVNTVLPGPDVDPVKNMLLQCSAALREGWNLLSASKPEMLGRDKHEAFKALSEAQDALNRAWEAWKKSKDAAAQANQEQRRAKRESFEQRVRGNIENLLERRNRLRDVLQHKASHLSDLEDKLASARGDDFRDTVRGWISEEEAAINSITQKLDEIERWIDEERSKL